MASPKNPLGVNQVCAQCLGDCKQPAHAELERCPLFRAAAAARGPGPERLAKPLRTARQSKPSLGMGGQAFDFRGLKSNRRGVPYLEKRGGESK